MKILVTGASGYVGGRLVPLLLDAGHDVRCTTRDARRLANDPWRSNVEVVQADALHMETLDRAMAGCDAAYYLIHSMYSAGWSAETERIAARSFAEAAARARLRRIVYLGMAGASDTVSVRSRHEVGEILAAAGVPVLEVRAGPIIGSGSVAFEMTACLGRLFPVLLQAPWMTTRLRPVAVGTAVRALAAAVTSPLTGVTEIVGGDVLTYRQMIDVYSDVTGLSRRIAVPIPLWGDAFWAFMAALATPLPMNVLRPFIDAARAEAPPQRPLPLDGDPIPYREAVASALRSVDSRAVPTRWSDSVVEVTSPRPTDARFSGRRMLSDRRAVRSTATAHELFLVISGIGGRTGYYRMDWAWHLRGLVDKLVGGVGLRRGRRDPHELRYGESLDFWRVAGIEPDRRLLLFAEMKLPGTAWLEWTIEAVPGGSLLEQTAHFAPDGVLGLLYWWSLLPFHASIFDTMARRMVSTAEASAARREVASPSAS